MAYLIGTVTILLLYSLWKARRDYRTSGTLSPDVVVAVWALYLVHAAAVAYAAQQSLWSFPLNVTVAWTLGSVLVISGATVCAAGMVAFQSIKRMSGLDRSRLVTSGIYRRTRNPQNVGWGILLLGLAVMGHSLLAGALVAIFWLGLHFHLVRVEEKHVERVFGDEYRKYCTKAPRYLW